MLGGPPWALLLTIMASIEKRAATEGGPYSYWNDPQILPEKAALRALLPSLIDEMIQVKQSKIRIDTFWAIKVLSHS